MQNRSHRVATRKLIEWTNAASPYLGYDFRELVSEIGGYPAYLCGVLVSFYGTLTGPAEGEDASQRQIAESLASFKLDGGGCHLFPRETRGDAVLYLQEQLDSNCMYNPGFYGVTDSQAGVDDQGVALEHHVMLPFSPKLFSSLAGGRLQDASPFDGAQLAQMLKGKTRLQLSQVGVDHPDWTALSWGTITVKIHAVYCYGGDRIAPMDRRYILEGPIDSDSWTYPLDEMFSIESLGLMSQDTPSTNDSNPLAIRTSAAQLAVEFDGVEQSEITGWELAPMANALGGIGAVNAAHLLREESSMQNLIGPNPCAHATQRPVTSELRFEGFNTAETDESLLVLASIVKAPSTSVLNRFNRLVGGDARSPQVGGKPLADVARGDSAVGVPFTVPGRAPGSDK